MFLKRPLPLGVQCLDIILKLLKPGMKPSKTHASPVCTRCCISIAQCLGRGSIETRSRCSPAATDWALGVHVNSTDTVYDEGTVTTSFSDTSVGGLCVTIARYTASTGSGNAVEQFTTSQWMNST